MSSLFWLALAVIVTALAAITGRQPKGARPVSRTRLMGIGRLVLAVLVIIFAYLAYRTRAGG